MIYLKVIHPLAAANPLIALFGDVSLNFVLFPVVTGAIVIILISIVIDISLPYLPYPQEFLFKLLQVLFGVLIIGLGSGFYLIANLGPGPRDGLMTGIQRITNFPIAAVRAGIEITVVSIGWYLGGTVGVGTLLFAFGIGPAVALGLYLVGKFFN